MEAFSGRYFSPAWACTFSASAFDRPAFLAVILAVAIVAKLWAGRLGGHLAPA